MRAMHSSSVASSEETDYLSIAAAYGPVLYSTSLILASKLERMVLSFNATGEVGGFLDYLFWFDND